MKSNCYSLISTTKRNLLLRQYVIVLVLVGALISSSDAATITSAQSGNWDATSTWDGAIVPGSGDDVVIAAGHTVTVNTNNSIASLTVNGTLTTDGTVRTITVTGSVTIASGGTLEPSTSNVTHTFNLGGNLTNNGTLNSVNSTGEIAFTFNGSSNQSVSGTGATTEFYTITINNSGSTNNNIIEISSTNFTAPTGGFLTLTNGILKVSGSFTHSNDFFTLSSYSIPVGTGLWLNNANATVTGQNGTPTLWGSMRITAGTYNIGTNSGNSLEYENGAVFTMEGGSLNVAGRFCGYGTTQTITFSMSGGTLTVTTVGGSNTRGNFDIPATGSSFTMSGGTIAIQKENTNASPIDYRNVASTVSITGGTVQFGNASTSGSPSFVVSGASVFPSININSTGTPTVTLGTSAITVRGDLTIGASTTLDCNNQTINIIGNSSAAGNWTKNGSFTQGTGKVTMNGSSAQTMSTSTTFNNLEINNSAGVSFLSSETVNGSLTFTAGNLSLGSNTLTLGSSATVSGAAATKCIVTNGSGVVSRAIGNGSNFSFEIGPTTTGYNPIKITNGSGSLSTYGVRVESGINPSSPNNAVSCLRTWNITSGAGPIDLEFRWLSSEAGASNVPGSTTSWGYDSGISQWVERGGSTTPATPNVTTVTGVPDGSIISPWTCANTGALPVELTSFSASLKSGSVYLKWKTATEINNYGFDVERSVTSLDGAWEKIGFVDGHGTVNTPRSYSFIDRLSPMDALNKTMSYRLKQIDRDGKTEYSPIVSIALGTFASAPRLFQNFPNPFSAGSSGHAATNITFTLPYTQTVELAVYNSVGREVARLLDSERLDAGSHAILFSGQSFSSGIYFYKLKSESGTLTKTMVISK